MHGEFVQQIFGVRSFRTCDGQTLPLQLLGVETLLVVLVIPLIAITLTFLKDCLYHGPISFPQSVHWADTGLEWTRM